jgi:hypothetical protein
LSWKLLFESTRFYFARWLTRNMFEEIFAS